MNRRRCRNCDSYGWYHETIGRLDGKVIDVRIMQNHPLPGLDGVYPVRKYTVECTKCGRKWYYHKKVKE